MHGRVQEAQQVISRAVTYSPAIKGKFTVEVDRADATKFLATYHLASGEMMCKKHDTFNAVNDWLLGMSESSKKGSLPTGLKKIESEAKPAVAMEKACDVVLEKTGGHTGLELSAVNSSEPVVAPSDAVDVTAQFLATNVPQSVDLPQSQVALHKGSIRTFSSLAHSDNTIFAVLLGKKAWNGVFHATNFVLENGPEHSVSKVLQCEATVAYAKALSLEPCGVVMAGDPTFWQNTENIQKVLGEIAPGVVETNLLFVLVHYDQKQSGELAGWEMNMETGLVHRVDISHTTQPHDLKKRFVYNLCWKDDLGISHMEKATSRICHAILKTVLEHEKKASQPAKEREVYFRKVHVPSDGLCGWYSLLAAENVSAWEQKPRNDGAFPINKLTLESEIQEAKDLHQAVCQTALEVCHESYHRSIRAVLENPSFSPSDLEWISYVCSTTVRVSCDPKAIFCQIVVHLEHLQCLSVPSMYSMFTYVCITSRFEI